MGCHIGLCDNHPAINHKEDKMANIMIAGHNFNVEDKYEEGHELTANEANALNQMRRENIRNNLAKKVEEKKNGKDKIEDDAVLSEMQNEVTEYASEYEFGERVGGGAVRDPVLSEAMRIARDKIWEHLKRKGMKRKDVEVTAITEAARKLLTKNPGIMELAKQRVAETQAAAASELEDVLADVA